MLTLTYYPATWRSFPRSWDPFRELRQMQNEMDSLADRSYPRSTDYPPLNVWTTDDEAIVQAELPGFSPDSLDISVVQSTLTLRGERKPQELEQGETFHRRERWTGTFVRTVELPFEVDNQQVEAEYSAGILSIKLPRAEANKPRKISVKAS